MFKNTASQSVTLFAVDASTGLPKTGDSANMVFYVSKDDGSVTAISASSGVPTESDSTNAKGDYKIALSQTETNADKLRFSGKSSTSNIVVVPQTIYTVPAGFTGLTISTGAVTVGTNNDKTGYSLTQTFPANFSSLSIDSSGLINDGSMLRKNTAQAGAATTITLDASASATDNLYRRGIIAIVSGTGAGQTRIITGYVGSTKVATVDTWTTNPDNTSVFAIYATGPSDVSSWRGTQPVALNNNLVQADLERIGNIALNTGTAQLGVNVVNWNASAVATPDTAGYPVVTIKDGTGQGEISTTSGAVDHVILNDTTTTNTDMRGTNSALLAASYTAPDNTSITGIKAKTDSLTFTQAGNVDANIQYVNDVIVKGTGSSGNEWGPGP